MLAITRVASPKSTSQQVENGKSQGDKSQVREQEKQKRQDGSDRGGSRPLLFAKEQASTLTAVAKKNGRFWQKSEKYPHWRFRNGENLFLFAF